MTETDSTTAVAEIELDAPVREVTLLEDRAQVRRRGATTLPDGRVTVRARGLASVLVDRSLHATVHTAGGAPAGDAARVIDARVKRRRRPVADRTGTEGGDVDQRIRELEAELNALTGRRKTLGKQRELLDQTARQALADVVTDAAWDTATTDGWRDGLAVLGERDQELRARDLEHGWREEELKEALGDLRRRSAAAQRPDLVLVTEVEVELAVTEAGDFTLELGYVVPAACWRPAHRARLLSGSGEARVVFDTDACVWQKTGEDWHDVELKLSTQRPTQGHKPPELREERLVSQPKPEDIVVEAREVEVQTTGADSGPKPASELPGIDDGGSALTLTARHKATLPSDGRPYRVRIASFEAAATPENLLIPELTPAVVRKVSLANAGAGPILAGPVDLVAGSGPIGRTTVLFVAPGERFDLGFGPDPAIRVRRHAERVEVEPNVLSRHLETQHTVTLKMSNIGTEPRSFTVRERIPVSEIEQVKVKLDRKVTDVGAEPDDQGFVSWPVKLPGSGSKASKLRYKILKRKDVIERQ